jgi:hypothetical protein
MTKIVAIKEGKTTEPMKKIYNFRSHIIKW